MLLFFQDFLSFYDSMSTAEVMHHDVIMIGCGLDGGAKSACGAHPAPCSVAAGVLHVWVMWPGREAYHSRLSSAEAKSVWRCTTAATEL